MNTTDQIKNLIAEGQTEEAIELLVNFTKENNVSIHDEAILLSGQYRQWKRQMALGIGQSNSELRRIEMSIMDILDDETGAFKEDSRQGKKTMNWMPILTGAFGVLAIGFGFLFFNQSNANETAIPIGDPEIPTETAVTTEVEKPITKPKTTTTSNVTTPKSQTNSSKSKPAVSEQKTTPPPKKKLPALNGKSVNFVAYGNNNSGSPVGFFRNMRLGSWQEESADFKKIATFKQVRRDDWSVYLHDEERDIKIQLDLEKKVCRYSEGDGEQRVSHLIKEAITKINDKYLTRIIYFKGNEMGSFERIPNSNKWLEKNQKTGNAEYEQYHNDEWSVYLRSADGKNIAIDMYKNEVKLQGADERFTRLYSIDRGF